MDIGWLGNRIEANVSDRINLKDSVASMIYGDRSVQQYGVEERHNGLLAKDFSGVF